MAPAEAELLALCDQDDRWYPEKLSVLRGALGNAQLVYSDQRLVDADGRVLRESMWTGRRNNHTDVTSLLVANSITGAATLFRREVADIAMPFPETPGMQFHDHWLGLVALAAGEIAYVDRPLYDYVQHSGAIFGDVSGGSPGADAARAAIRARDRHGTPPRRTWRVFPRLSAARHAGSSAARAAARAGSRTESGARSSALSPALNRRRRSHGSRCGRCGFWRAETRHWGASASSPVASPGDGSSVSCAKGARTPGRRPIDARYPNPLSFEQKRLRRWRAQA